MSYTTTLTRPVTKTVTVDEPVVVKHKHAVGDDLYYYSRHGGNDTLLGRIIGLRHGTSTAFYQLDGGKLRSVTHVDRSERYTSRPPKPEGFPVGSTVLYGNRRRKVVSEVEWGVNAWVQSFLYAETGDVQTDTVDWTQAHYTLKPEPVPVRTARFTVEIVDPRQLGVPWIANDVVAALNGEYSRAVRDGVKFNVTPWDEWGPTA